MIPPDLTSVLHEEVIMDFSYTTLPQLGPPIGSSAIKAYQAAIKLARYQIHSVTLIPHPGLGNQVTLPTWIFDYWRER